MNIHTLQMDALDNLIRESHEKGLEKQQMEEAEHAIALFTAASIVNSMSRDDIYELVGELSAKTCTKLYQALEDNLS